MPAHSWTEAAASFLGMWTMMTVAMMLPSLVLVLWRYRTAVTATGGTRLGISSAIVGTAYLLVWMAVGLVAFPMASALDRVTPFAAGVLVVLGGACQLSAWKAHYLACCRHAPAHDHALRDDSATAWRHGVRTGLHCVGCCANLMAIPLVMGIMDARMMVLTGAVITAERVAPASGHVARSIGVVLLGGGLLLMVRAGTA